MLSVRQIAEAIVAREGGYVNDPDDPGGATNFGVTIGTMARLGMDLDGDGKITPRDVRNLTKEQAVEIFERHYFYGPRIHLLPESIQASVFDMYVNAGSNAVKILQRLINTMDVTAHPLEVDGVIGPVTATGAEHAKQAAPNHLADAYGIARRDYHYALGDRRVKSRKYARRRDGGKGGWIKRAEEFISPQFHLTDAEHRQRVAAWG